MEKKTKYWLIPNNPNVYDAIGAFKELKEIDWEKVRLVLGDGFVEKIEVKSDIFDEDIIKDSEYLEEEKFIYNIKKEFDFSKFKD
jgi:hypothetical protein